MRWWFHLFPMVVGGQGQVVRYRVHGFHRVGERKRFQRLVQVDFGHVGVFEQPTAACWWCRVSGLWHVHAVGVADDHVQSAVFVGAVRFVSGVDDRRSNVVCKPTFIWK